MQTAVNIAALLAVLAVVAAALIVLFRKIEHLAFPGLSFEQELRNGNVAVGIVVAALIVGLSLIASRAVGAPGGEALSRYDDAFRHEARLQFGYGQDWRWFKGQGMTESKLDAGVCSQAGACGVMQFMPGTAAAMGLQNRFDAHESIRTGVQYDRQLWGAFHEPRPNDDRLAFVFSAYNWGIGNVQRKARPCARARSGGDETWGQLAPCLPLETQAYFPRIRQWLQRFGGRG